MRRTALVGTVVGAPLAALLLGAGDPGGIATVREASALVSCAVVLGAGALSYFYWRMLSDSRPGSVEERHAQWLVVGLTAGALTGLLQLGSGAPGDSAWLVLGQLTVLASLCLSALLAEHVDVPGGPVLASAGLALVMLSAYALVQLFVPDLALSTGQLLLVDCCVMLVSLGFAWVLLHRTQVSLWARRRLAMATVLIPAGQCLHNLEPQIALMVGATVCNLAGALLLCSLAHQLFRRSVLENESEIAGLHRSLADVRAVVARERDLLHEIGATLAGISTASQLMRGEQGLDRHRRRRLESMLACELARLERLVLERSGGPSSTEDRLMSLDEVVEPVVTSHQVRGRHVSWCPSGQTASGDPDEVAELCNILLENAARHAPGAPVTLRVTAHDGGVEVVCTDSGPGVAPELRHRIFEAEVRRGRSPGRGLGLAIARRLATGRGGRLDLVDDGRPGATFVAVLPTQEVRDGRPAHVA